MGTSLNYLLEIMRLLNQAHAHVVLTVDRRGYRFRPNITGMLPRKNMIVYYLLLLCEIRRRYHTLFL